MYVVTDHKVFHFSELSLKLCNIADDISSSTYALPFLICLQEILNSAGFLASNSEKYPLGDIVATVKKVVGATPQVVCKKGSVQELRICFNKDFKVHNFSSKNQLAYIVNHLMVQITLDTTTTKHFSQIFVIGYMHPSLPPISDGPSMGNNGPSIYLNMGNNVVYVHHLFPLNMLIKQSIFWS